MRKAFILALLLTLTSPVFATVPVSGNLKDLATGNVTPGFVRFELVNCPATPRIVGTGIIVNKVYDFKADASGAISGSIYTQNEIDCNGVSTSAYTVQAFIRNTPVTPKETYCITESFNINSPPTPCAVLPASSAITINGYTWRGAWSSVTIYKAYDTVSYNGSSYVALLPGSNHQPDTSTSYWSLMAQKGDKGEDGAAGAKGDTGATGATGPQGPQGPAGANGTGSGTVTVVTIGNLAPLFTASVATPNDTPAISFALSTVATGNKILASPNGAGGLPSYRALVGDDLPNPGASSKGGVTSKAAEANKFLTGIGTDGVPTNAQPSSANLSDNANIPKLDAASNTFTNGITAASFARGDGKLLNIHTIQFIVGSDSASSVLLDTDDQNDVWINGYGQTFTISQIYCKCDGGSPTIMLKNGANNIQAGNLTCSTSGASTTSFSGTYNQIADGGILNFTIVSAGGTAKRITVRVKGQ